MEKQWSNWRVWRLRRDDWHSLDDHMIEEAPVSLIMAGEKSAVLMATPGLEAELGAGFAMTMLDSTPLVGKPTVKEKI